MPTTLTMPRLTQTMDAGKVLRWLRLEGDAVTAGQTLLEVETDKAAVEVDAPVSGFLGPILVPNGVEVSVGTPIAQILVEGEEAPRLAGEGRSVAPSQPLPSAGPTLRASPLAKKLAAEHGLDLAQVRGSGPGGRIDKDDVLAAVAARGAAIAAVTTAFPAPAATTRPDLELRELSPIRKATAESMAASSRETALVTLFTEIDATELMHVREMVSTEFEKIAAVKLSITHLVLKACAIALAEHPYMLAQWEQGRLRATRDVNIGLAVAMDQGLLVPVLRAVDGMSIKEIASRTSSMVERARKGALSQSESSGGTFTVTNLGMYEVDGFTPIINPPETAILGIGRFVEKPAVHEGRVEVRQLGVLSLSFDHRVVDGAPAAAFLQRLKTLLEIPQILFL